MTTIVPIITLKLITNIVNRIICVRKNYTSLHRNGLIMIGMSIIHELYFIIRYTYLMQYGKMLSVQKFVSSKDSDVFQYSNNN